MLMAVIQILASCSTSQKTSMSCPDLPDARYNTNAKHFTKHRSTIKYTAVKLKSHRKVSPKSDNFTAADVPAIKYATIPSTVPESKKAVNQLPLPDFDRTAYIKSMTASADNKQLIAPVMEVRYAPARKGNRHAAVLAYSPGTQEKCDTIVSIMGDLIVGKVIEINEAEVKYKKCGDDSSPVYTIRRGNISVIKYANGTKDTFAGSNTVQSNTQVAGPERKIEGLGLAGFVAGIAGLFVLGIPFGLFAFIVGLISLTRIKRSPARYIGRGYAIAAIVLGIIDVVGVIILLSL